MSVAVQPETPRGNGARPVTKSEPVIAGTFTNKETIAELLAAATALERVGYEPKLKFAGDGDDPAYIELIVDDVGDIMTKLRFSLATDAHAVDK